MALLIFLVSVVGDNFSGYIYIMQKIYIHVYIAPCVSEKSQTTVVANNQWPNTILRAITRHVFLDCRQVLSTEGAISPIIFFVEFPSKTPLQNHLVQAKETFALIYCVKILSEKVQSFKILKIYDILLWLLGGTFENIQSFILQMSIITLQ